MNELGEHDELSRLVRRFRRAARLLAVHPLRSLPMGSLTPLMAQSAPLERLLAAEPLERLRQALLPKPEASREGTAPTRLRRPVPAPSATAPSTERAMSSSRDAPRAAASTPHSASAALGASTPQRDTSLAQRRARLRHQPDASGTAPRRLEPIVPAAELEAAAARPAPAKDELPPLRPPRVEPTLVERLAVRRAAARRALVEAGAGPPDTSAVLSSLAPRLPDGATPPSTSLRSNEAKLRALQPLASDEASPSAALQRVAPSERAGRANTRPAVPERAGSADAEARVSASRVNSLERLREWDPHAGLEQDEPLFEALYREGVDLQWP